MLPRRKIVLLSRAKLGLTLSRGLPFESTPAAKPPGCESSRRIGRLSQASPWLRTRPNARHCPRPGCRRSSKGCSLSPCRHLGRCACPACCQSQPAEARGQRFPAKAPRLPPAQSRRARSCRWRMRPAPRSESTWASGLPTSRTYSTWQRADRLLEARRLTKP